MKDKNLLKTIIVCVSVVVCVCVYCYVYYEVNRYRFYHELMIDKYTGKIYKPDEKCEKME